MSNSIEDLRRHFVAEKALVFYKNDVKGYAGSYGMPSHLLQMHDILGNELAAGSPVTMDALVELVSIVTPQIKEKVVYLPSEVILHSPINDVLAWWRPADVKTLFFLKNTGIKSGRAPVPPTLFAVHRRKLHVWALKKNERPGPDTSLYHSPYYNVFENGTCMGNMTPPRTEGFGSITEWESLFFNSYFTLASEPKLKGITAKELWRSLISEKKKKFPVSVLKPLKGKVRDIPDILR